jgi:elongation factor Ts
VAVEVNAETDFVAKNADFQSMVGDIANVALGVDDMDALTADISAPPMTEIAAAFQTFADDPKFIVTEDVA